MIAAAFARCPFAVRSLSSLSSRGLLIIRRCSVYALSFRRLDPLFSCCRLFAYYPTAASCRFLFLDACFIVLLSFRRPLRLRIVFSALGFVFVLLVARMVYCFAAAWFLYCVLEARLVFLLWVDARFVCAFTFRRSVFVLCRSVCALSFRCSVSCFACCPAASRVCYCSFEGFCFLLWLETRCVCASSLQTCRFFLICM